MTKARNISYLSRLQRIIVALSATVLLLMVLIVQWQPSVPVNPTLDNLAINTIEQLIVDNAPASISAPGEVALHLDNEELNLLAAFLLQNVPSLNAVTTDVRIADGNASIDMSIPLDTPLRRAFINVHTEVRHVDGQVELYSVRLGYLPIPSTLVRFIRARVEAQLASTYVNYQQISDLQRSITAIDFQADSLEIRLNWDPALLAQVQTQAEQLLLSAEDKEKIVFYFGEIITIVQAQESTTRSISLSTLLNPLFGIAYERTRNGANPLSENRALLQALSLYVNESDLSQLVEPPSAAALITPRRLNVTIQRRPDLAQHFTSSAAMSATVGAGVAGILSTSKEVHDARYRSGFSFSDLTANTAGVALGMAATKNAADAQRFALRIAQATDESDYMPPVSRENAGLTEDDFSAQFTDRNSDAYREKLAQIDAQIAALPIYLDD